ncbi:MAG: glycerol-3-phosphate dehydrogenase/oxidase [Thermomicrobiales bacterium]|nr:glycerol-3-phosphate dehydrogenase/oxidase [Thermomicrobiales bacterium]
MTAQPTTGESENLGHFDLIIIGAGINGVGIARDAALRGQKVLLLDKGDIASGTTTWPTRLIHGGLRYLEYGEVGLVRESLRERERLLRNAPHLVQPFPMVIPIYQGDTRRPLTIRAGMVAYDALSLDKSLPRHRMLSRDATLRRAPGLLPDNLLAGAMYYDAQVEYPERLALENALDAVAHGAVLKTYHKVERITSWAGKVTGVAGRDVLTGKPFHATSTAVLNVAGPWVDEVLAGLDQAPAQPLMGGTKGTHLVVDPFPGAPATGVYAEARLKHRPFFVIPWNDAYLVGTTDTRYTGDLDELSATDDEIDWMLQEVNTLFPRANLTWDSIRYSYAGVRPLPSAPGKNEGAVTRRHMVVDHATLGGPQGLFSVVGGKLTTYRELAEHALATVDRGLGRDAVASVTSRAPLPGAPVGQDWQAFRAQFLANASLPLPASEHLLRVYGSRAAEVADYAKARGLTAVIDEESGVIAAEVPWAFEREGARTLADVVARRTMSGLGPSAGVGPDRAIAKVAQNTLGWDAARADQEVAAYRDWVRRYQPRALAATVSASS